MSSGLPPPSDEWGDRDSRSPLHLLSRGTIPLSSSRRLELRSTIVVIENPVTFPPGCAKLSINPDPTGSRTKAMTIGIVEVARLAASVPNRGHVSRSSRRSGGQGRRRRRAAGRGGATMRSILGGPRILDRRFVPADRMVTTETQPLSQDRSEIPERHNFRCKALTRRRVMTMATATPPMEMDGLS